ncbi:Tex-like N-terminal domain-containing protein [Singulisphaera sp. Ch08]|uniref:Tex-like N-terminal domain-containing protein n=1 Tax=Singulisphaera sp. Ch08 TaxID=3120278 RepID=A0AAU7CI74_9BACT
MDTPIQVDLGRIAQDLQIRRVQVESVVLLLDEGNTVPFITRYRKERTGNLNEVAIREIQLRVGRLRELAERKETILKTIEAQGKLSDDLAAAIRQADNPKRLEDLYLPFKPKKKTKASEARERGLEPLALRIWNRDETLTDLTAAAAEFINPEKEIDSAEKALEGVRHILAEAISEMAPVRDAVRRVVWKTGKVVTSKTEIPEGQGLEYRDYFNYSEPISHIPPHRVLAINRGDKEGPLKVKLDVPRPEVEAATCSQLPLEGHPHSEFFHSAALDALDRLLMPSMEREVRRDLTDLAERHAVDVFARNLRSLLLQPPIPSQVVLAIDPGFRTGCKVAVLDGHGTLLEHGVIHPHPPQNRRSEAKLFLKDLVGRHQVGVIAIGNQSACRETEELVAEVIAEGTFFNENPGVTDFPGAPVTPNTAPAPEHSAHEDEAVVEESAEETEASPADAVDESAAITAEGSSDSETSESGADQGPDVAPGATFGNPAEALPPISGGAPESGPSSEVERSIEPEASSSEPAPAPVQESAPATPAGEVAAQATTPEATEPTPAPAPAEAAAEVPAPATESEAPAAVEAQVQAQPEGAETPAVAPTPAPAAPTKRERGQKQSQQPRPPRPKPVPMPPKPHAADVQLAQLTYVIVNEAGASVYSASPVGREEFPDFDATLRGTISIGRRLQDPLSELVKIEPQSIGVGLYQHDINSKQLKESLESVIASCVNFVGVDLNTASVPLLRHVSGMNQLTARRLVDYRKEKGPFTSREQLTQVEGIGPATYTQAAGFLKIRDGEHPLDRTWIHPESYEVATRLLEKLGFAPDVVRDKAQLPALHEKLNEADVPTLARELEVGEPTLHDIFEALARPERDPRDDLPKPIFKKGVLKLEDLTAGMELKGTVLNVVDFGAFVDIGLKDSGLVHISQLANRYIKSPHDVVSVGDVVTAWVMGVDHERKRVSLTMVKPGTERPRGGHGPGSEARAGGGGGRRGAPEGQEGRGAGSGRPPRREGSAPPASQPAGAGAPGGGAPARRPEGPSGHRPGGFRPGQGQGGPGRGGPRTSHGGGPGRFERAQQPPRPTQPTRPSKPAPPPPPLSKDALAGSVPLRSFGQLKQLWQARVDEPVEGETPLTTDTSAEQQTQATPPPAPAQEAPAPTPPEPAGDESAS